MFDLENIWLTWRAPPRDAGSHRSRTEPRPAARLRRWWSHWPLKIFHFDPPENISFLSSTHLAWHWVAPAPRRKCCGWSWDWWDIHTSYHWKYFVQFCKKIFRDLDWKCLKTRNHLFSLPVARGTLTDVVVSARLVHTDAVFTIMLKNGQLMVQLMI